MPVNDMAGGYDHAQRTGLVAQDRPTSKDFSMPETSIKTGDVDFILPLDKIAPKLMELAGAGSGRKNRSTATPPRRSRKARKKSLTPRYPAATKPAMLKRRK